MIATLSLPIVAAQAAEDQGDYEVQDPANLKPPARPQEQARQQTQPRMTGTANRQPTAEEVRQMMQGVMGPMMAEMMSSMLKSMSKTLAEPEIAKNLAAFMRNYYQALIDNGFSPEEALKIVSSTGLPSMGGMK